MKKIAVFTSARSDYGLLKNVIKQLKYYFDVNLFASGAHFSHSRGYSYSEIVRDGLLEDHQVVEIEFLLDSTTAQGLSKAVALAQISIAQVLHKGNYDGVVILGDRYELFGISIPALLYNIPLFHISGGELTEGVIDENIRHAHTKLSHIHFAANDRFAENISSIGEEDWRICVVGECGLDNIYNSEYANSQSILNELNIDLNNEVLLITYHPSTLEYRYSIQEQILSLLHALEHFKEQKKIFTACGIEQESHIILNEIKDYILKDSNALYFESLGSRNYLSVLKGCKAVIGNSSSGIVEAPSFGIPTVNVGNRQKNRVCGKSVINCGYEIEDIKKAITKALDGEFVHSINKSDNPYDPFKDGRNSERIAFSMNEALELPKEKLLIKKFKPSVNKQEWNFLLKNFYETI